MTWVGVGIGGRCRLYSVINLPRMERWTAICYLLRQQDLTFFAGRMIIAGYFQFEEDGFHLFE
jgi:hypothetical protein